MKRVKIFIASFLAIFLLNAPVFAETVIIEEKIRPTGIISENERYAEGMENGGMEQYKSSIIEFIHLELFSDSESSITIEARTRCVKVATVVGFKDITLQKWNGSKWVNVITPWDDLKNDGRNHDLLFKTQVEGGNYYKVSLYHYGQEGSGIFANKQEVFNETSYLWID